ncbi:MAG TPA: EAL domain-containing protein [Burkholderiaceae bacterium]|nr:EAL domain-containing protein [Burkholderiaceae bacterium]
MLKTVSTKTVGEQELKGHDIEMATQHKNYAGDIVNRLSTGIIIISKSGEIRSLNPAAARIFALSDYACPTDAPLEILIPSPALKNLVRDAIATGAEKRDVVIEVSLVGRGKRDLSVSIAPTKLEESAALALFIDDITAPLRVDASLKASEERFRMTFDLAAVGLAHIDMEGRICKVNGKLCNILGYSSQELLRMNIRQFVHRDDLKDIFKHAVSMVHDGLSAVSDERCYRHKRGHYIWVSVNVSTLREDPEGLRFIFAVEDISQRKQAEEKLAFIASHDALTSLPNRILAEDRLSNALIYARRARRCLAVMFVDLDRFKHINDSLGHGAGDTVIVEVARRLSAAVRTGDTVSRLGGDEFVVILADVAQEADIESITRAILHSMYQPMRITGQEIFVSASIGVAVYPKDGQDSASLLRNADTAMYRAKDFGRNNVQFYTEEMCTRIQDRLRIKCALRFALERNEFLLHYQPQVDIASGKIIGVEALIRWQREGHQIIPPANLIHIAEENGLIVPIGEWAVRTACSQQATWRAAGMPPIRVSVNLSARQFRHADLVDKIIGVLAETHCEPSDLSLEITESVLMDDPEIAATVLRRLSHMGVHLAIDDFGTGYSSLSYLKRFPIDTLKIDRSFVQDVTTDADDASIVRSIIALSHAMRMNVIAEGVETRNQLRFLREQGCDQMQGYLFSRPLAADELMHFLQKDNC